MPLATRRFVAALTASVLAGLCLPGANVAAAQDWKKEWDETVARAAGQELALAVHSYDAHIAVAREFQKRFPDIKVKTTPAAPSAFAPRVVTEQRNGVFAWDSWWAATANMNNLVLPRGGFDQITDYLILPEVKDPANWRRPDLQYTSDKGPFIFIHTYYFEGTGFYNKDMMKGVTLDRPQSYLDPRLKGLIAIEEPKRPNGGSNALSGLLKSGGPDVVRRMFTEMEPTYLTITRQVTDMVVRGEKAISLGGNPEAVSRCWLQGGCKNIARAPHIDYLHSRGVAVMKNAPHKDATKVWINWLLSKEGQEVYVKTWAASNDTGAVSMRKDVEHDPKHEESVPPYAEMEKFVMIATERGKPFLEEVTKLYNENRR